ncbi:hypothetical protein [Caryophanon latum]|uniref:SbsA Ig-like domain-containing protein n=1 Tax=Caryophanon latum TaxID=33977 RepID=A0A1C0YJB8_9BACL|nr:hypothetical protein [Caryophanon latum]OCS87243.1 hypothetical protein A6K76_02410 [Caryophanon latum]
MKKTTAFYVASAALATTVLLAGTHTEASAASIVPEEGYKLLEKQNMLQTFDLSKDSVKRTINFSLPVDATTVKANENIVLFDVTASKKVTINATAGTNKTSVEVELADGYTYEEGHEYRLLIGNTIKNLGTNVMSLQQAIQFNYKTINVNKTPATSNVVEGMISAMTADAITIGNTSYSMSDSIAKFVTNNKDALSGATMKATLTEGKISAIEKLSIAKEGAKLVGTSEDVVTNTTITVEAENVTLHNLRFANLFVSNNVKQALNVSDSTISGKVETLADRSVQAAVEEQHATTLVIRFTNSVVVEMLISRIDVKSEISGTSKFILISVKSNTNIWVDPQVVLPKLTIEDGVTHVQLNGSIAQVDIRTNNDLTLSGTGNFEKINVETDKHVTLDTQGTVKEMNVQNQDTTMTIGDNVEIEAVKIPESSKPEDIIDNYEDVKDQIGDKIEEGDLQEFITAKFVRTDVDNLMGLSVVGVSKDANVSYQHYDDASNAVVPNIGEKLTGAIKWTTDTKVLFYMDRDYYVFVTDENDIITDRYEVHEQFHKYYVEGSQTGDTLTIHIGGYTKDSIVNEYVQNLYVTDGKKSEVVDLTKHSFHYDEYGRAYINIDVNAYDGEVSYFIEQAGRYLYIHNLTNYFSGNWEINGPHYVKAIHDFAKRANDSSYVNSNRLYQSLESLLKDTNYEEVDYVSPTGDKYKTRVSLLSPAPSVEAQYVKAFSEKQYENIAAIQQKVTEINTTAMPTITAFNKYNDEIDAMYREDNRSYLNEDVTLAQIDTLKQNIEGDSALQINDKEELLSRQSNLYYAYYRMYQNLVNELKDENGLIKAGVTEATIDELIAKFENEIGDSYKDKERLIDRLQTIKEEFVLQPFKRLENRSWKTMSERIKANVTSDEITEAYTEVLSLTTTDERKDEVEQYYSQMKYYFVMKEVAKYATTNDIQTHLLIPFKADVTKVQIESIFASFKDFEGSYKYSVTNLKETAIYSLDVKHLFNDITYSKSLNKYVLLEGKNLTDVLPIITTSIDNASNTALSSTLEAIVRDLMSSGFNSFYTDRVLQSSVTKQQIDEAYKTMMESLAGSNYVNNVTTQYYNVLLDYYELKVEKYLVEPSLASSLNLSALKEGTTSEQLEQLFADWQPAAEHNYWYYSQIDDLKERIFASLQLTDALALLKPRYFSYTGEERLASGTVQQFLDTLLALKEKELNDEASDWVDEMLTHFGQAAFNSLKETNGYYDGNRIKADVTLEDINKAYETSKAILNDELLQQTYDQYVYYYYAKEASKLLTEPIQQANRMPGFKADVTEAQIDTIFANWTFDDQTESYYKEQTETLRKTLQQNFLAQDLLNLFDENSSTLVEGVTVAKVVEVFEQLKATIPTTNTAVHMFIDNKVKSVILQAFKQLQNEAWSTYAEALREDVTLAQIDEVYNVVKVFNLPEVEERYKEAYFYYYMREVGALTGIQKMIYAPVIFEKEASRESVEAIFETWIEPEEATYNDQRITNLKQYTILSASLQDVLTLLDENYSSYSAPLLAEGVTIEAFLAGFSEAMNTATADDTKQWLTSFLKDTVIRKAFSNLFNSEYDHNGEYLREEVTLTQIQEIYDTLLPFIEEKYVSDLTSSYNNATYYYYFRELVKLAPAIAKSSYSTYYKLAEGVTLETIEAVFKDFVYTEDADWRFEEIELLRQKLVNSYSLNNLLALTNDLNSMQPFNEGVTVEQIQAAYEEITTQNDEKLTSQAEDITFKYVDAFMKKVLAYSDTNKSSFGFVLPNVTAEQIEAVIADITPLKAFFNEEKMTTAIDYLTTTKALAAFNTLLTEDGKLKADTTLASLLAVYNDLSEHEAIEYELTSKFNDYVTEYYERRIEDVTGKAPYSKVTFTKSPTIADIEAIFTELADLANHTALYRDVTDLYEETVVNYYVQPLLKLTEYNGWYSFSNTATMEKVQKAVDVATASNNEQVMSDVTSLFTLNARDNIYNIGNFKYDYDVQETIIVLNDDTTVTDIENTVQTLTAYNDVFHVEEVSDWITLLTEALSAREVAQVQVKDATPEQVVVEHVAQEDVKTVSLEQLASYSAVASFITTNEYGYTIAENVDRTALQAFVEELTAVLEGIEGEEQLQLLLQLATDALAQPIAFVPFSLA